MTANLRRKSILVIVAFAVISALLTSTANVVFATPPDAPAAPTLTSGNQQLIVTWAAPTNNGGSAIAAYDLRYKATGGKWLEIDDAWTTGDLTYTITGLTNDTQYAVEIRAENDDNVSPWSTSSLGTPVRPTTTPGAPTSPSVSPGNAQLVVSWSAPAGNVVATGYDVRHITSSSSDKSDGNWTVIPDAWTSNDGALTYTITGLTNGTQYDVQVRADNGNTGAWSNTVVQTPRTVPSAPRQVASTPENQQLTITWATPNSDGGATITAYDVQHSTDGSNWTTQDNAWTSRVLTYTISSLTNGQAYRVQVRAVNVAGDGPWASAPTGTDTTPRTVPGVPTTASAASANNALDVTWTAPSNTGGCADYQLRRAPHSDRGVRQIRQRMD